MRGLSRLCRRVLLGMALCGIGLPLRAEMHALLVGVSSYPALAPRLQLEGPRNDIPMVRAVLQRRGFKDTHITTLADGVPGAADPTRAAILGALDSLVQRVAAGDFVYLHLAGHGSQMPVAAGSPHARREPDGLHEIFLPRDVGPWNDQVGRVDNAIADHELNDRLEALLARGAFVFAVFDACHSATLMRGVDDGVRYRQVNPADLGVSDQAMAAAAARARELVAPPGRDAEPGAEVPLGSDTAPGRAGRGGFVAFYAAQTTETTPEMRLPAGHPQRRTLGLFSFTLAEALGAVDGVSYRQLGQHVLQRYAAQNLTSPTPLFTGTHLDAPVFGRATAAPVRQWPIDRDKGLSVPAGVLSQLTDGEVLAVVASPLAAPGEVLGYLRVEQAEVLSSRLVPVAHGGLVAPDPATLPPGAQARQVAPLLNLTLRVAGPPGPVPAPLRDALRALGVGEATPRARAGVTVQWVPPGQGADLRLVAEDGQLWLVGAGGQLVKTGPARTHAIRLEQPELEAVLAASLQRIGKALNLLRIAAQLEGTAAARNLDVQTIFKRRDGSRVPLQPLPQLTDGDVVEVSLHNKGRLAIDLTALYVDGDWGIGVLYPVQPGASNRIEAGGRDVLTLNVHNDTTGLERLLLIAVQARAGADRYDFSFMAQARLERTRAADAEDPLVATLVAAGFGDEAAPRTRGARPSLPGRTEMRLLQWRVLP